jgi:hypothetical protein
MNAIYSAFQALANFARSLNRLTGVIDKVADEAERRVDLVGYTAPPAGPALLTEDLTPVVETNGHANGEPVGAGKGRARR